MIESDITAAEYAKYPSPCYVLEERLLRRNLSLIKHVADSAHVEIILAEGFILLCAIYMRSPVARKLNKWSDREMTECIQNIYKSFENA